jgi:cyanate permease
MMSTMSWWAVHSFCSWLCWWARWSLSNSRSLGGTTATTALVWRTLTTLTTALTDGGHENGVKETERIYIVFFPGFLLIPA